MKALSLTRVWLGGIAALGAAACGQEAPQADQNGATPQLQPETIAEDAVLPPTEDGNVQDAGDSVAPAANVVEEAPPKAAEPAPLKAGPAAEPKAAAAATVERPKSFAMCATCHSSGEGDPHRIGPNLFGVVGSKAGTKPGYAYSDAMKESGITWTAGTLRDYLLAPRDMVPGTKMMVGGPKDEAQRQAIVDYLATLK